MVSAHGGKLAVGLGHEGLQSFFKQLVGTLGGYRLLGCGPLGLALGTLLEIAVIPPGRSRGSIIVAEIVGAGCIFPGLLGLQTLDGQIDLAVFIADNDDLHILTLSQMGADVADVGIGNLRNMYHAGLVFRQGDECAEIGDGLDFSVKDCSNG